MADYLRSCLDFMDAINPYAMMIVSGKISRLTESTNDYDWLGNGIYFWENDPKRALQFARFLKDNPARNHQNIKNPAVIGAAIDLGFCFNLMETESLASLKNTYGIIRQKLGRKLPKNKPGGKGGSDLLLRNLDRLVIETTHTLIEEAGMTPYDTVRGLFFEGEELYPNAGFREKNHIQICVRNPNCIKAYFLPRELDAAYPSP